VIEAARLCALADGGQILASDLVRALAGRRGPHTFLPVGALELKGLPEPVEAVSVAWEPATVAIPLPSRLGHRPTVGVVGRDAELEAMAQAHKRAVAGEGRQVVLIGGEAGMGKTTLTAEFARSAFDDGAIVFLGRCDEELAAPYQLFAEALSHLVIHAPDDLLASHVAEHGSALAHLVPALSRRLPDLPHSKSADSDTERYLLFAAVVGLLASAARAQPVVLVLEDLHWADKSSLALLRHVMASAEHAPLTIVTNYRDTELARSHPFLDTLGVLRREHGVTRIELSGLDDAGVLSFMEAAAGQSLDEMGAGLAHALYRETDGNPFFVYELLRHLSETEAIFQDETGRWATRGDLDELALPTSVREVIGARLARLGEAAERALSLAAVIGREFDLELLASASGRDEDELIDMLDAAAAAALVRELPDTPGQFSFRHSLIQHTLYEDLGPTRRARSHQRVAESLEELCAGRPGARVGALALHWSKATAPIDMEKAFSYARLAAEAAAAELAPDEALRYFSQALTFEDQSSDVDPRVHLDLLIGLGTAQRQVGNPSYRDTLLDAARGALRLGDTERLVAAALANNRGYFSALGVMDTERVEVLEAAVARVEGDQRDRALLLATLCAESTYGASLEVRHDLAKEADAIAHRIGDDDTIVRVSNLVVAAEPELVDESLVRTDEALIRAGTMGDPVMLFWANAWRGRVAVTLADIEQEDRCLLAMGSSVEWLNQPTLTWYYTYRTAARALLAGDPVEAERMARKALDVGTESGQPDAALLFGTQFMSACWQRGTVGELVPLIEQTIADNPGVPAFGSALAVAFADADRTDEAHQVLDQFASAGYDLPPDAGWLTGMTLYADAATACRHQEAAAALVERLRPWGNLLSYNTGSTEGLVSHYLGCLNAVLGHFDEAEARFAQATAFNERVRAEFFGARTDLSWGTMLLERASPGDGDRARELITKARSTAATRGYAVVERRSVRALEKLPSA
jgi:hypothetical protein